MLDADEQRLAVGGPSEARDFATDGADHEALDFAGHRIADEHLVIALAGEVAFVFVISVRLDPDEAGFVEREAVGRVEHIVGVDVGRTGSANVNADNMFNSPDGLALDETGLVWIQTDGNYKNEGDFAGQGNNQMLVGDPVTGEIKRFMVGPIGCEVTGFAWAADRKTLFVGIQHPGEKGTGSHFPRGGTSVPRSCVVAIRKDDGSVIG